MVGGQPRRSGSAQADGPDRQPRRALLARAGALTVSVLAAAGCGSSQAEQSSVKRAAPPVRQTDIDLLVALLELERHTVAAYTAGIPFLSRPQAKMAKQFLDEELEHTGELLSLIKAAGGPIVPRAASYELGHPTNAAQVLTLLHGLERDQLAAYLAAIPRLSPGPVRAAASSILSSDAQHLAIIRLNQGQTPAPSAFVSGAQ